jgi:hypothetical protein
MHPETMLQSYPSAYPSNGSSFKQAPICSTFSSGRQFNRGDSTEQIRTTTKSTGGRGERRGRAPCLEGGLGGAEGVEGQHDLGDNRVRVSFAGGGGGALPSLGDDRGALHEPHGAVRPRRLQVLRRLVSHPAGAPPRGVSRFGGLGCSGGARATVGSGERSDAAEDGERLV